MTNRSDKYDRDGDGIIDADVDNESVDTQQITSPVASLALTLGQAASVTIAVDEHQQCVVPSDRSYDVDGELVVDGSFTFLGV